MTRTLYMKTPLCETEHRESNHGGRLISIKVVSSCRAVVAIRKKKQHAPVGIAGIWRHQ